MKGRLALLAAILLIGGASAAINDPQPFEANFTYVEGFDDDKLNIVSGALNADLNHVSGTYGFFDVGGLAIEGLERVCWNSPSESACHPTDPDNGLAIRVLQGGSVGLRLPLASDATYTADHVLALFVDFRGEEDLNSFGVGQTLTAPAVNGVMTFENIRHIAVSGPWFPEIESAAGLVPLDEVTAIQLVQDGAVQRTFTGKEYQFSFEGEASIAPFATDLVFLPFEDESVAFFERAGAEAAREGLRLERIDDLMNSLQSANAGASESNGTAFAGPAQDFERVLSEVMNGAVMRVPLLGDFEERFAFINFETMRVDSNLNKLDWSGSAALQVMDGEVEGAPNLVGIGYFVLPWWSFMLWGIALAVWIVRLSLKTDKEHEVWDRYKWIGWVFGAVGFILLFWLWDMEVRSVWGTSLFTTDSTGVALAITAAIQIAPLLFVMFAVAAPLRMMFRNGLLLARQGTFMGLSTGVAYLLAYVIGATLLLAYIELILIKVLENVGG